MVGARSRALLLLAFVCVMPAVAEATTAGAAPSHHDDVDQSSYPWSAIGKLTNETGASCSAVMVARDKVLTAAHCLYNRRARRFVSAETLHFLLGYRSGRYAAHARVSRYEIGEGFDPQRYDETSKHDWALLTLTEDLPASAVPLKLSDQPAPSGTKAMLAGYPQDREYMLTADRDCELRGHLSFGRLMVHSCRSNYGTSGAPILVSGGDGEVRIAGIQIAAAQSAGAAMMIAVPVQVEWRRELDPPKRAPEICIAAAGEPVSPLEAIRARMGFAQPSAADLVAQWQDWPPEPRARKAVAWLASDEFLIAMP